MDCHLSSIAQTDLIWLTAILCWSDASKTLTLVWPTNSQQSEYLALTSHFNFQHATIICLYYRLFTEQEDFAETPQSSAVELILFQHFEPVRVELN